jgi:hypothetical protein
LLGEKPGVEALLVKHLRFILLGADKGAGRLIELFVKGLELTVVLLPLPGFVKGSIIQQAAPASRAVMWMPSVLEFINPGY